MPTIDPLPLVTVGVASYNNSAYILDTLNSILSQSYPSIELIIIDDCSKEQNVRLIQNWIEEKEVKCLFLKHEKNLGITKTCNDLLNHANGEYIALIGSDDIMNPDRIQCQVDFFQSNPECSIVFSDMTIINGKGEVTNESYFQFINETVDSYLSFFNLPLLEKIALVIKKNIFPAPSMMYRVKTIKELGGWDENLYFEDWDMVLRLISKNFQFGLIEDKLVQYRVLNNSTFRRPNSKFTDSLLALVSKYRGLNNSIDEAIDEKINQLAIEIYQLGGETAGKWLSENYRYNKNIKSFIYYFLSLVGIKYKHVSFLFGLKRRLSF